jgi:GMP synthase-like glutamine amidotransferase
MNQLTIGILVTNTDTSQFAAGWPRDGEKFSTLLKRAQPQWTMNIYDCTQGEFPSAADECHAYVIGGSPASVNDDSPWIAKLFAFIRTLNNTHVPAIGCCFGHQAIAKALGGSVGRNPDGWGFGVAPTQFAKSERWMEPFKNPLHLFAAHSEQVIELPPGARTLGGDRFCPIASFAIGQHIFTTEYHPEMTLDFFMALTHAFEKYIGVEVADQARLQAETCGADGQVFAQWMVHFFQSAASS